MEDRHSRAVLLAQLELLRSKLMDIWIQDHFDHNEALSIQIEMHRLQRLLRELDASS